MKNRDRRLIAAYYPITYKSVLRDPKLLWEYISGGRRKLERYVEAQEKQMFLLSSPASEESVSWHRRENSPMLADCLGVPARIIDDFYDEYLEDHEFRSLLASQFASVQNREMGHFKAAVNLYPIVRLAKPEIVVETGVGNGVSASIILSALRRNGQGTLHSVEAGSGPEILKTRGPGWVVPEYLKPNWKIHIGMSHDILSHIMAEHKAGLFIHDSDHSSQNMTFELETAWSKMPVGGVCVVDDVDNSLSGRAFERFCARYEVRPHFMNTQFHHWRAGLIVKG